MEPSNSADSGDLPKGTGIVVATLVAAAYGLTTVLSDGSLAFFVAIVVGILAMLVAVCRPAWGSPLFWLIFVAMACVHAAAIFIIPMPKIVRFGALYSPLGIIDALF